MSEPQPPAIVPEPSPTMHVVHDPQGRAEASFPQDISPALAEELLGLALGRLGQAPSDARAPGDEPPGFDCD